MSMPVMPGRTISGTVLLRAAVTALLLSLPVTGPALAQSGGKPAAGDTNGATIQWAQQILDAKGLYQGRAHGRMDAATAAAVSAYQKSVGLKATGRLDQATIDKLLAERAEKQDPTVGNLADPKSRAKSSGPILREQDVRPQAAPTVTGVERGEGGDQVLGGGTVAPAPSAAAPLSGPAGRSESGGPSILSGSRPQAAPSVPVEGASPRSEVTTEGPLGGSVDESAGFVPPDWARYGLLGGTGLLVLGMLMVWWLSGRRPSRGHRRMPPPTAPRQAGPVRREPSLGPAPGDRRAPTLSAPPRDNGLRAGL